jgi:membrane protease YdiL (CAAX protease family)
MNHRLTLWTLPLAFTLWFFAFGVPWGNFWFKLAPSAAVLALIALVINWRNCSELFRFELRHLWVGPLSAVILYAIFWGGKELSALILPFLFLGFDPSSQIQNVYANKTQLDAFSIALLLLFVMGPAEEIFWRGLIQRALGERYGVWMRILLATSVYALIHLVALNFMLIVAAAICGFFWGWLYEREKSLVPVILSHSLWDLAIFVLLPLG